MGLNKTGVGPQQNLASKRAGFYKSDWLTSNPFWAAVPGTGISPELPSESSPINCIVFLNIVVRQLMQLEHSRIFALAIQPIPMPISEKFCQTWEKDFLRSARHMGMHRRQSGRGKLLTYEYTYLGM